ncbi:MAG TPA: hypothetical protein VIH42_05565 [Thermoguttaceae bacterium]
MNIFQALGNLSRYPAKMNMERCGKVRDIAKTAIVEQALRVNGNKHALLWLELLSRLIGAIERFQ